MIVNKFLCLAD